jgi:hypothetical protein
MPVMLGMGNHEGDRLLVETSFAAPTVDPS